MLGVRAAASCRQRLLHPLTRLGPFHRSASSAASADVIGWCGSLSLCSLRCRLTLAPSPLVHTWGAGNDGELGHGQISKTGMRNSYEELLPRQVETAPAGCTHIGLGKTHNGLGKCTSRSGCTCQATQASSCCSTIALTCFSLWSVAVSADGAVYTWGTVRHSLLLAALESMPLQKASKRWPRMYCSQTQRRDRPRFEDDARTWVDDCPSAVVPYLKLIRIDRPAGGHDHLTLDVIYP